MNFFRKYFLHSPVRYLVAFVIAATLTLVRMFTLGVSYFSVTDGLGVGGIITILFGMLVLIANLGAFNIFVYSISSFSSGRKYKTYADYTEAKQEERKPNIRHFVPYVVVGAIFMIASMIMTNNLP